MLHFNSLITKMSCHLLLDHIQFTLIHGSNIPGSYATFFFTASYFMFSTRLTHNWASFPLWPSLFILSGPISLLFPHSILDTYWAGGLIFRCYNFLPFHTVHGILKARVLGVVCHSLLQHTMLCQNSPTWPIHLWWPYMAWLLPSLSYTRLWIMRSFWLAFCDCGFHSEACKIVVLAFSVCPLMNENKWLVQGS